MTRRRKVLIAVAVIIVVLTGVFASLITNLDWIVKRAIEHYGSEATKTAVRVGTVAIRLTNGEGTITGLTVGNPKGFSSSPIFSLGRVSVRIESRTAMKPIVVIDDIYIAGTRVVYETDSAGHSNVDALKKNLDSSEGPKRKETAKKNKKEKRLRIRRLVIENSTVEVRSGDKPRTITLGKVEMKDIGGPNGATPDRVAEDIVSAIAGEAGKEAAKAGAKYLLQKELERALRK
jgi:hypothetical protein